jgi:hypothetical protein
MAYSAVSSVQQGVNANELMSDDGVKKFKGPKRVASGKGMKGVDFHSPMVGKVGRGNKRGSTGYHSKNKRATY